MIDATAYLILLYLRSAACVYGKITLRKLHWFFSEHNPGMITLDAFCRYALKLQGPAEIFRIIGDDDIYRGDIAFADADRWVVHRQYCYATWDTLFSLAQSHEGKLSRLFPRETFLQYADPGFIPDTPQVHGLTCMLRQHSDGRVPLPVILRSALQLARDDCDPQRFLREMQRVGCCFGNLEDRLTAVHAYKSVWETVPKPVLNGNSELYLDTLPITRESRLRYDSWSCSPREGSSFRILPEKLLDNVPFTGETEHQVFLRRCVQETSLPQRLLDPCFCGSGLYYADCCGKR